MVTFTTSQILHKGLGVQLSGRVLAWKAQGPGVQYPAQQNKKQNKQKDKKYMHKKLRIMWQGPSPPSKTPISRQLINA